MVGETLVAATVVAVAGAEVVNDSTKPNAVPSVLATMAILGMINFTFAWLRPDGRMSYEQYAELVCDIVVNGLAPAPDRAARASA